MDNSTQIYLRLLRYMRPYRARFVFGLLLMGISSGMEPLIPILLKPLLDGEFNPVDGGVPWGIGVVLVLIVFFRGVIGYIADYLLNWLSNQVVLNLRQEMFVRVMGFSAKTIDATHSSQIINKLMHDVSNVMGATTTVFTSLVRDSIALIGLLAWLFWLNWQLTLIFLLVAPLAGWVIKKFSILIRQFSLRSMQLNAELLQILQENVESYRIIKIFGGHNSETDRFEHAAKVWKKQQMRISNAQSAVVPFTQIIASVAMAIVIVVAAYQAAQNILSVGAMMSYITASIMLMPGLRRISGVASIIQRGIAASKSVFELIDTPIEDIVETKAQNNLNKNSIENSCEKISGKIEFKNLSFVYPLRETNSLTNINLTINNGESVAIVGASGAGKSTIASLICAFYRDYQGSLKINGEEVAQIDLYKLRKNIAIVTQEVRLFDNSIRANIAYGELADKTDDEIIAAAKSAYAWDFINKLPNGLQTQVGEHGVRLSGGQRQRIVIARAILKNAQILILDEATSALDSESEIYVQKAINNLMQNRTTIVIAHRLSTIRMVNRIVVMEQGHIVEEGNHEQLISKNGVYIKYLQMQNISDTNSNLAKPDDSNTL